MGDCASEWPSGILLQYGIRRSSRAIHFHKHPCIFTKDNVLASVNNMPAEQRQRQLQRCWQNDAAKLVVFAFFFFFVFFSTILLYGTRIRCSVVWYGVVCLVCWVSYPQRNGNEPENHWPTGERQTMPIRCSATCNTKSAKRSFPVWRVRSCRETGSFAVNTQFATRRPQTQSAMIATRLQIEWLCQVEAAKVNAGFSGQWRWRWWDNQTNKPTTKKCVMEGGRGGGK